MTLPPDSHYARKRGRKRNPETGIQAGILRYLQLHPSVSWVRRMNSGAGYILPAPPRVILQLPPEQLCAMVAKAQWMEWGFVGCSDIIGQMHDGRFVAAEVKHESPVTTEQAQFLELVQRANGCAGVVRNLDDAREVVDGG